MRGWPLVWMSAFLSGCAAPPEPPVAATREAGMPGAGGLQEVREVAGPGRVEPRGGVLELGLELSGRVSRVLVSAGEVVGEGAPLLELDRELELARVARARADLDAARARWDAAGARVAAAVAASDRAESQRVRAETLAEAGVVTPEELERARAEAATLLAERVRAEADQESERGARAAAEAALALARAEERRGTLRAPVGGSILRVNVTPGAVLSGFQPITAVELAPEGPYRVLAEVDELFAGRVEVGQRARVVDPATGGEVASGVVEFVAPALRRKSLLGDGGGEFEDRRVREVHVRLEDPAGLLLGTRVEVRVEVQEGAGVPTGVGAPPGGGAP